MSANNTIHLHPNLEKRLKEISERIEEVELQIENIKHRKSDNENDKTASLKLRKDSVYLIRKYKQLRHKNLTQKEEATLIEIEKARNNIHTVFQNILEAHCKSNKDGLVAKSYAESALKEKDLLISAIPIFIDKLGFRDLL